MVRGQFHAQVALSQGKNPWDNWNKRMGGLCRQTGCCGEDTNLPLPGIEPQILNHLSHCLVTIPTTLLLHRIYARATPCFWQSVTGPSSDGWTQASPWRICGGQSCTETRISPSISFFPVSFHQCSIFSHSSWTLHNFSNWRHHYMKTPDRKELHKRNQLWLFRPPLICIWLTPWRRVLQ